MHQLKTSGEPEYAYMYENEMEELLKVSYAYALEISEREENVPFFDDILYFAIYEFLNYLAKDPNATFEGWNDLDEDETIECIAQGVLEEQHYNRSNDINRLHQYNSFSNDLYTGLMRYHYVFALAPGLGQKFIEDNSSGDLFVHIETDETCRLINMPVKSVW